MKSPSKKSQTTTRMRLLLGGGALAVLSAGIWHAIGHEPNKSSTIVAVDGASNVKNRSSVAMQAEPSQHAVTKSKLACDCGSCQAGHDHEQARSSPVFQDDVRELLARFDQGDQKLRKEALNRLVATEVGKHVSFVAGGIEWHGVLDSKNSSQEIYHVGVTLDDDLGRFQASVREDGKVLASFLFTGENKALAVNGMSETGEWQIASTVVENILCTKTGAVYTPPVKSAAQKAPSSATVVAAADSTPVVVPILNSRPESSFVIYCDYDGETVNSPHWNGGQTIVAPPLDEARIPGFITKSWRRAAEDWAPFDINVTTDRALFDATPVAKRVHIVMTTNSAAAPGAGGVAMLGSFGADIPCWCFNNDEGSTSETISHEVGHTMGLRHDGIAGGEEYYGGHGSGISSFCPIMGANFADIETRPDIEEVSGWSKGEYQGASNLEDDLAIIVGNNGFSYNKDDAGDSRGASTKLSVVDGTFYQKGIIERNTDTDWYSFATRGGNVRMNVKVVNFATEELATRGTDMAVSCELYDSSGKLVQSSNREDSLDASIYANVAPGTYYVKVDGVGRGNANTGFTNYAALGSYTITGSAPLGDMIVVSPSAINFPAIGGQGTFNVSSSDTWTWTCDATWVHSIEAVHQAGNQQFEYTVDANDAYANRQARITFTNSSNISTTHTIYQAARVPDDHGDTDKDATAILVPSITNGRLNVATDVDCFQVQLTDAGYLTAYTSGSVDTYGELYDSQGTLLARSEDVDKRNFRIMQPLQAGTYYVKVGTHAEYNAANADYLFHAEFASSDALLVSPATRAVSPSAGEYAFDVTCQTNWSWSIWIYDGSTWTQQSNDWLQSVEPVNQSQNQRFTYTVAANITNVTRKAQIRFTSAGASAVHEVVQLGVGSDDYGNTIDDAKVINVNQSIGGVIESEGDVDVFQIDVPRIGELKVGSMGVLDTYGELCDQDGNVLDSNDDFNGINFGITRSLQPGRYFVRVRHYDSTGTGGYSLFTSFTMPTSVTVTYKADRLQGSISGTLVQKLRPGANGRRVTARARSGYAFVGWSDGVTTPSRIEYNVLADTTLTALFSRIVTVQVLGGAELVDNNINDPVRFPATVADQPSVMSFVITNNGPKTLTRINVTRFGVNASEWSVVLPKTTLAPRESMIATATFKSSQLGYRMASLTVNATGNPLPFRIPVQVLVAGIDAAQSVSVSESDKESRPGGVVSPSQGAGQGEELAVEAGQGVEDVDQDGLVHHSFTLPNGQGMPEFWLSKDAKEWIKAEVVELKQLGRSDDSVDYEVVLSAKELDASVVIVSKKSPQTTEEL